MKAPFGLENSHGPAPVSDMPTGAVGASRSGLRSNLPCPDGDVHQVLPGLPDDRCKYRRPLPTAGASTPQPRAMPVHQTALQGQGCQTVKQMLKDWNVVMQVGKDVGAQKFLAQLDNDPEVGRNIDATSYYELEAEEYKRKGVTLTPDVWLVKLMMGAIDSTFDEQD